MIRRPSVNLTDEGTRIIIEAAKLIKSEVRSKTFDIKYYPTMTNLVSGSASLLSSLESLMKSIGLCILKATRPNSVTPSLLFGLGVEVDHVISSKTLLIELAKLGYSISYNEVQRYKQSLMSNDIDVLTSISTKFAQFVSDNVDHNVCILDVSGIYYWYGHHCIVDQRDRTSR